MRSFDMIVVRPSGSSSFKRFKPYGEEEKNVTNASDDVIYVLE